MLTRLGEILLKDLKLDDKIIIEQNLFNPLVFNIKANFEELGTVIGIEKKYIYVGHDSEELTNLIHTSVPNNYINWNSYSDKISFNKNIYNFSYFMSFTLNETFQRQNVYLCSTINIPDQKCDRCKLPAPHSNPNKGNIFICSSCQFLSSLELGHY